MTAAVGSARRRGLCAAALGGWLLPPRIAAAADTIDIARLMQALMLPKGTTHPPDWNLLDALPIAWTNRAPVAASVADRHDGMPQQRSGSFVLGVRSKPAWRGAGGAPGRWQIGLLGSAAGVSEVRWSPQAMAEALEDGIDTLAAAGFVLRRVCQSPGVTSQTTVWRIARAGSLAATLVREFSAGSAGQTVDLSLRYTRSRVEAARCPRD